MGDACESRAIDHKFFDLENVSEPVPMVQAKREADIFLPVCDQCLAWLMGNHEYGVQKYVNMTRVICEALCAKGVEDSQERWARAQRIYGGMAARLTLNDTKGQRIGKVYLQHKTRTRFVSRAKDPEQRRANKMASVKESLVNKASDCHVMACAHAHQLLVVPPSHIMGIADNGEELESLFLDDT